MVSYVYAEINTSHAKLWCNEHGLCYNSNWGLIYIFWGIFFMRNKLSKLSTPIILITTFILLVAIGLFVYGVFVPNKGDPKVSKIESEYYNTGWELTVEGELEKRVVNLPFNDSALTGKIIHLKKVLPEEVNNKMVICTRSSQNDLYIYVNGELRNSHSTGNYDAMSYNLPSAYVFADLSKSDSQKEVEIVQFMKTNGVVNDVTMGYSGNVLFNIYNNNILMFTIATIMVILGALTIIMYLILSKKLISNRSIFYVGALNLAMGLWLLSESALRQWMYASFANTDISSYLTIEIVGVIAALYFDAIQDHRYHKIFTFCESVMIIQILLNCILAVTGMAAQYQTLILSHIWMGVTIAICIATLIRDIVKRKIKSYIVTAFGFVLFMILAIAELIQFYTDRRFTLGVLLSFGLILLMFFTLTQIIVDELKLMKSKMKIREEFTLYTIETVANSIDAKDKYTGGHSVRVAAYAKTLATAVAKKYHFSDEDIQNIHYIGLMHDIGKIAIPDTILNKTGALTNDEFTLMKQHVNIGANMLHYISSMSMLPDGVKYHHERYDGKGYPDGLKGEEIPIIARILCLADSFDAMTSNRIYRRRLSDQQVLDEIKRCAGTQFDPYLAEVFCDLIDIGEMKAITHNGLETDAKGNPYQASVLESLIHKTNEIICYKISNPEHIRMACYLAKTAEQNEQKIDIYLVGFWDRFAKTIRPDDLFEYMKKIKKAALEATDVHDIVLDFTLDKVFIMFYNKPESYIKKRLDPIRKLGINDSMFVERISMEMVDAIPNVSTFD